MSLPKKKCQSFRDVASFTFIASQLLHITLNMIRSVSYGYGSPRYPIDPHVGMTCIISTQKLESRKDFWAEKRMTRKYK